MFYYIIITYQVMATLLPLQQREIFTDCRAAVPLAVRFSIKGTARINRTGRRLTDGSHSSRPVDKRHLHKRGRLINRDKYIYIYICIYRRTVQKPESALRRLDPSSHCQFQNSRNVQFAKTPVFEMSARTHKHVYTGGHWKTEDF